jgi:hypothetical protein
VRAAVVVVVVGIAVLGTAGSTCAPAPVCEAKQPLVDHDAWTIVAFDDDPWRDVAPPLVSKDAGVDETSGALVPCDDADVSSEPLSLEPSLQLSTLYCSWLTVEQPLRVDVRAGEPIHTRLWYFQQTSYPAATAELALTIGDDAFMEESLPIPAPSGLFGGDYDAPADAAEGTPIRWHLGNHGGNTWNLIELTVLRDGPCPDAG